MGKQIELRDGSKAWATDETEARKLGARVVELDFLLIPVTERLRVALSSHERIVNVSFTDANGGCRQVWIERELP